MSVPEFGGVLHFDRDARQALEQVFSHQTCVPACSTPQNEDALRVFPQHPVVVDAGHVGRALLEVDPSADGVSNGSGLLVNLLEHEVVVSSLFQGSDLQFDGLDFWGDFCVTDGADGQFAVSGHRGDFLVLQVDHVFGVGHNGRGVRPHKEVVVAPHADHERTGFAGSHQAVWMGLVQHHNGVSADHFFQRDAHGVGQVEPCGGHDLLNEMCQHLGVGVAHQGVASVGEQLLERLVILDDAVVDDCDSAFASRVGVGVAVAWGSMGGPAGVPDAHGAGRNVLRHVVFQVGDLALFLFHPKLPLALQGGDACAVVAPVFQTSQTLNQDGVGRFRPQVAYNSAHAAVKFLR